MKKTISVSLGNTLFYVEEDAYADLDAYLRSIRGHFASYPDRDEIVADIELRISEKFFSEKQDNQSRIITKEDVKALIAAMGEANEFDDGADGGSQAQAAGGEQTRKLYRDPDQAVIGGVASGIAAYLGIDTVIVRILFILSVLFGGTGILVYIVLWLAIPEAASPTEKLQMKGSPVTIDSVKRVVEEKVDEIRTHANDGRLRNVASGIARFFGKIARFFSRGIFPIAGRLIGIVFALAATFMLIAGTIAFFSLFINYPDPNIDFPLGEIMRGPLYYVAIVSGYVIVVVPIVFLFLLALTLVRSKNSFSGKFAFPILAIWLISAVVFGIAAVRASALHALYTQNDPSYQQAVKNYELEPFSGIKVRNGNRVVITQAATTTVSAKGRERDMEFLDVRVEDGTLIVGRRENIRICILCWRDPVELSISVPDIETIELENASYLETGGVFAADSLSLKLRNASRAHMALSLAQRLDLSAENASFAELEGEVGKFAAKASNSSRIEAAGLTAADVVLEAENGSHANVFAVETLDVTAQNGSRVDYEGEPALRERITNGSRVRGLNATSTRDNAPNAPEAPEPFEAFAE